MKKIKYNNEDYVRETNMLEKENFVVTNISVFVVYLVLYLLTNYLVGLLKFLPYKIALLSSVHITMLISLVTTLISFLIGDKIFNVLVDKKLVEERFIWIKHLFSFFVKIILDLVVILFLMKESFTIKFSIPFTIESFSAGINLLFLRPTFFLILAIGNITVIKRDKGKIIYSIAYGIIGILLFLIELKSYYGL